MLVILLQGEGKSVLGQGEVPVGWYLLVAANGAPRFIARDGRAQTGRLERALGDRLGRTARRAAALTVEALVERQRTSPESVNDLADFGDGLHHLVAEPVVGPAGLHALHIWIGAQVSSPPTPPPLALAFTWDTSTRLARFAPGASEALFGAGHVTAHAMLQVLDVPEYVSMMRTLIADVPGSAWAGTGVLAGGATVHLHLQRDDETWRGLLYDVSSTTTPPPPSPTEAVVSASLAFVPDGAYMAIADLHKIRIIDWVTDPLPDIAWKGMRDQRDAPHPDDVQRIFASAAEAMQSGRKSGTIEGIRLRRLDTGWTVVDARASLMPLSDDGPPLMLIQLQIVGHSDEPDPVPVTDSGHPGL